MSAAESFATGHRGYDDFDERRYRFRRRPPLVFFVAAAAVAFGVPAAAGGLMVLRDRARVARADAYVAQYGIAHGATVTRAQRCQGLLLHGMETSGDPRARAIPLSVWRKVGPRLCATGVARGVVRRDGDMARADAEAVLEETVRRIGATRFRTIVRNALSVRYHLAPSASKATRWDRCVAQHLLGYDVREDRKGLPKRARWSRAVRNACTAGIRRGLVRADGGPRSEAAFDRLLVRFVRR